MPGADVAVIGGGIAGTAVAAFLGEAGLRVALYERDSIAAGASGRNSGVVQHPLDPVLAELYRSTLAEYRQLAQDDRDARFRLGDTPAGLLYVGRDEPAARRLADVWRLAVPETRPEIVGGRDLVALEPALAPDLAACRLAIGYPVEPSAATRSFAARASRAGVSISVGRGDARPAIREGRAVGVSIGAAIEAAGDVIVAAGPWTPDLIDPSGEWRPIIRSWGVVASVALPGAPRHALESIDITIEPSEASEANQPRQATTAGRTGAVDFSLVPADGSSALGSTFLPAEPDPRAWLDPLRDVGSRYVPGIARAAVLGLRSCARPVSRDGRPLIGRAPAIERLWILAGHGPWGISTGPGSARLLADRILGRIDDAGIAPDLRADRFG